MDSHVRVYGTAAGTYTVLTDDGNVRSYPRIDASFIDPAN